MLHSNCSNNQAKEIAIVKAIEAIDNKYNRDSRQRTTIIYTDSRVDMESLKYHINHKNFIEGIGKK